MNAVILAGGLGTRLQAVLPDVPKPMAPIHGRPFLEYLLDYWLAQGVQRVVLSVGYRRESIISHFGSSYRGAPIDYVIEETPLGTGGAVLLCLQSLGEGTFLLLNGDTYFEVPLRPLQNFHREREAALTMVLAEVDQNARYGEVTLAEDGRLAGLTPASGRPGKSLINGGVYLIEKKLLESIPYGGQERLSFEADVLPSLLRSQNRSFGWVGRGKFIDIGVPSDYDRVTTMFAGTRSDS